MTIPTRRVRIVRDGCSPLWAIRCVQPECCEVCHLGGYGSRESATEQAKGFGYKVEESDA